MIFFWTDSYDYNDGKQMFKKEFIADLKNNLFIVKKVVRMEEGK